MKKIKIISHKNHTPYNSFKISIQETEIKNKKKIYTNNAPYITKKPSNQSEISKKKKKRRKLANLV